MVPLTMRTIAITGVSLCLLVPFPLGAQETLTRGQNMTADVASDGRIAIDLLGDIWIVQPGGGEAAAITRHLKSARRPRWSPDGSRIAYQAIEEGSQLLWIYDLVTAQSQRISRHTFFDLHPAWHPDGERLVYASDSTGKGFDLWEVDLATSLHWRLSDHAGDETDPAWSADGRDLVYVHHRGDQWSLILRRHGLPEETLVSTTDRLAGPAWRPDSTLITYVRKSATEATVEMVVLSQPRLVRPYMSGEDYGLAPLSWLDRHRMVYTADGFIRQRLFNSWTSTPLPFRATILAEEPAVSADTERQPLPRIDEPGGRLIIHASRLFDGLGDGYQADRDIVIDGAHISAVEPHVERSGSILINMGDLTVLPGYIDVRARLAEGFERFGDDIGAFLLTTGVTTIVAQHDDAERLNTLWSGKDSPGPRLLSAAKWPVARVAGMADSMTPGLVALLDSRQAQLIDVSNPIARRFAETPWLDAGRSSVVLASFDNGLPAGIALHAEFRALAAAGLRSEQSLRAAGVNAAAAIGVDPFLGRIAVGAAADLVFVDGDPLANIEDALKIVAVVRNGRFFSVRGLIDRVQMAETVE